MKHARPDYDRIQDPAGLIPKDEPVFLLRAQDTCAPHALVEWIESSRALGVDEEMLAAAERQLTAMAEWQREHGHKAADMPKVTP